jgi:hypothetical protein
MLPGMAAKKKRPSRWASEAALQGMLRYDPQVRALAEIQREAEGAYRTGVAQARGNADATIATIGAATPAVRGIYDQAGLDQARSASVVNHDLAGLPGLSPDLQAAIGLEQQNASSRVSTGRAQALTGLQQQRVGARAGGQYATNKAHDDLVAALTKIFSQRQSLAADRGAFETLTAGQLQDKATARSDTLASQQASRDVTTRGQDLSHQDRVASQQAAAAKAKRDGRLTATGAPALSQEQHNAAAATVRQIARYAAKYKGKLGREQIVAKLSQGRPQQSIHTDPDTGEKLPNPISLPAIPAFSPDLRMTAALDVAIDGHLSRETQQRLAKAGYRDKDLDLPTYGQWKRQQKPATRKSATQAFGQALGAAGRGMTPVGG